MAEEAFSNTQLAMLERRWRRDPSPHLSLQLADLYRQRDRLADAVPVLEKALEEQPRYVSLQVALGRYRLDAGDASGAATILDEVVQRDAGHLVANKLLVKAFLALGDAARASDRLELYSLLNDGDPELASLRAAVSQAAPFADARPTSATDLESIVPPSGRALAGALDREPFEQLADRPLRPASLASIFAGVDERWEAERRRAETDREPAVAAAPPAVEPAAAPETYETRYFRYEARVETEVTEAAAVETPAEEAPAEEPVAEAPAAQAPAAEAPAPAAPPRELDRGAAATATLGALYLAQGHLEDARETFEQVLGRDPEDVEARAGLEEVARRQAATVALPLPVAADPGRNRAKIEALERYLGRIRAAAGRGSG
jgi:tetratricopeptide (TPR) repeat protein